MESELRRMMVHSHDMWLKSVIAFLRLVTLAEYFEPEGDVLGRCVERVNLFVNLALRDEDEISFIMRKEWV